MPSKPGARSRSSVGRRGSKDPNSRKQLTCRPDHAALLTGSGIEPPRSSQQHLFAQHYRLDWLSGLDVSPDIRKASHRGANAT
jgi:hypothetical protein